MGIGRAPEFLPEFDQTRPDALGRGAVRRVDPLVADDFLESEPFMLFEIIREPNAPRLPRTDPGGHRRPGHVATSIFRCLTAL